MPCRFDFFVSYRRSYERNGRRQETAVGAWVKQVSSDLRAGRAGLDELRQRIGNDLLRSLGGARVRAPYWGMLVPIADADPPMRFSSVTGGRS